MTAGNDPNRWRRQIEQLLNYPRVGALTAHGIAANLGASQEAIQPVLDSLVAEGQVVRMSDGRFSGRAGASAGAADGDVGAGQLTGHDGN